MAITINIYYRGKNGNALLFAKEMLDSGIVDEIRKEDGNLKYEYYLSLEDEETILLIDKWQNQEAFDNHHRSMMMEKIIALRNKYELTMEVHRYEVEDKITHQDQIYIKK